MNHFLASFVFFSLLCFTLFYSAYYEKPGKILAALSIKQTKAVHILIRIRFGYLSKCFNKQSDLHPFTLIASFIYAMTLF